MSEPRIGSLFSGIGGLDLAVLNSFGGSIAWHVELAPEPSQVLAHHFPNVPNYGDITTVDWNAVEPITILVGGFPCQDVSLNGLRKGLRPDTRSGLWAQFAHAIATLEPELVIIENVRGLLSAPTIGNSEPSSWDMGIGHTRPPLNAFGAVLLDLAALGYDASWGSVRASDAGAPHERYRVFVVANRSRIPRRHNTGTSPGSEARSHESNEPRTHHQQQPPLLRRSTHADTTSTGRAEGIRQPWESGDTRRELTGSTPERYSRHHSTNFGDYSTAIRRWENVLGRAVPAPTKPDGTRGQDRMSVAFVEWFMGYPAGYLDDVGLSYAASHRALGNSVMPLQAELAIRTLVEQ